MSDIVFVEGVTPSGERVALRSLEMNDLDRCLKWVNDPELRLVTSQTLPFSRNAEQEWIERMTQPARPCPADLVFAIVVGGVHIGVIGLHGIDFVHRRAITGIVVGEKEYRGRRIGHVAEQLVIRYAFAELHLEVLRADIFASNVPSIRMHEACGYTLVARIPQWFFKGGQWQDELVYLLTHDAWRAAQHAST